MNFHFNLNKLFYIKKINEQFNLKKLFYLYTKVNIIKVMAAVSRKQKFYDAYYNNFNELLDNLTIIRPNDISFLTFKGCVSMYVGINGKNSLVDTMNLYIKDYTDKIIKKDESFFLKELINNFKDDSFVVSEISKIREIWMDPSTSLESKEIIWKHFIIFARLSKILN